MKNLKYCMSFRMSWRFMRCFAFDLTQNLAFPVLKGICMHFSAKPKPRLFSHASHTTRASNRQLQDLGIAANEITKLRDAGIYTVTRVQQTTCKKLLNIKGLSEAKVEKIKQAAAKLAPSRYAAHASTLLWHMRSSELVL